MKKIILSIISILLLSNCYFLDSLGLNLDQEAVLGRDAKNKIMTYALIGAGPGGGDKVVQAFISRVFLTNKIRDDRFYNAKDVDECAQNALLINAISQPLGTAVCMIKSKEREFLIEWPVKIDLPFF